MYYYYYTHWCGYVYSLCALVEVFLVCMCCEHNGLAIVFLCVYLIALLSQLFWVWRLLITAHAQNRAQRTLLCNPEIKICKPTKVILYVR